MKKIYSILLAAAVSFTLFEGCKKLDPVNPNLSEDSLLGQPNSSDTWLNGLERQLAIMLNDQIIISEIASDNYENTQTFYNQYLDKLDINYQDNDINNSQFHIARLREMADYGLTQVGPADEKYTTEIEAEYHFFYGVAHLYAAMYYKNLPGEKLGVPLSKVQNLNAAVSHFDQAIALNPDASYSIAKARAYYLLGDAASAVIACDEAMAADNSYLRVARFDPLNTAASNTLNHTENDMQLAIWGRGSFDDLQPLPSLDFLDPKYSLIQAGVDADIALFKIEEAYLIKAEAQQSQGNDGGAIQTLTDLFSVVSTRPMRSTNDGAEDRDEDNPGSRPDTTDITVDGRAGLVLYRGGGNVDIPSVSGTSYTAADLAGQTGDDLLELIYRIRQEVFIAEGIRSVDMGITYVLSQNERQLNPNTSDADITADIPSYLTSFVGNSGIDDFTYTPGSGVCTIDNDITALIVANKTSAYVCPFH